VRLFQIAAFVSPAMLLAGLPVLDLLQGEGVRVVVAGLWVVTMIWRIHEMLVLRNWAHWSSEKWRKQYIALEVKVMQISDRKTANPSPSLSWRVRWFLPILDGVTLGATAQLGATALVVGVAARMLFALINLRRWRDGIQDSVIQSLSRTRSAQTSGLPVSNQRVENRHTVEPLPRPADWRAPH